MTDTKVGIALIGCGRIARNHFEAYANLSDVLEVVAVIDTDEDRAKKGQDACGASRYYLSIEDALDDDEVEALDVCLAHALHCSICVQALDAKRHVICEKPLACSLAECDEMIAAADRNRVWLMSGQSRRFNGPLIKARELIEAGEIGKLLRLNGGSCSHLTNLATPWWGTKDAGPSFIVYGWGSHTVDHTLYLAGARPVRVYAQGFNYNQLPYGPDEIVATITLDNGSVGTQIFSCNANGPDCVNGVIGTKGWLRAGLSKLIVNGDEVPGVAPNINDFTAELREFASAVLENREPWTSARKMRDVYAVLDAIVKSVETNEVIEIEPA